jgi:hypothetical protein
MKRPSHLFRALLIIIFALLLGACATRPLQTGEPSPPPPPGSVLKSVQLDQALEDRLLALDPDHISGKEVRDTLSKAPAPHIVSLHGGLYPANYLTMTSFAEFLISMGYPEARIRRSDGVLDSLYSYSPYQDSREVAGLIAWYYERDGLRPMMVGHSQGGVQAVKILYDLAGASGADIHIWNPVADVAEDRTTIMDPLTGVERPVVGMTVPYVSAVGAGGAALLLPNQWSMVHRLRTIPDSVEDFTGFTISVDLVAMDFPGARGASEFHHNGKAQVRNVVLPSGYNHAFVPVTRELAANKAMRHWLNAYVPDGKGQTETLPPGPNDNALWAADVWFSIKKHWCIEVQRLIRAKRALVAAQ